MLTAQSPINSLRGPRSPERSDAVDIGIVMNTMRDPGGVPAHPVLFQGLMILTWILHIAFVHLTLGAAALAI